MEHYDVRRLALVLAIQAEIEGMKLKNEIVGIENVNEMGFTPEHFDERAESLRNLAFAHNEQIY